MSTRTKAPTVRDVSPAVTILTSAELNWRALIAAIVTQAVRDAHSGDPVKALDACFWMMGPDAALWLEAAGLPYADPFTFVTSGRAQKISRRLLYAY